MSQENVDIAKRGIDAFNRGDLDRFGVLRLVPAGIRRVLALRVLVLVFRLDAG